jgi:hypothetical protein
LQGRKIDAAAFDLLCGGPGPAVRRIRVHACFRRLSPSPLLVASWTPLLPRVTQSNGGNKNWFSQLIKKHAIMPVHPIKLYDESGMAPD